MIYAQSCCSLIGFRKDFCCSIGGPWLPLVWRLGVDCGLLAILTEYNLVRHERLSHGPGGGDWPSVAVLTKLYGS